MLLSFLLLIYWGFQANPYLGLLSSVQTAQNYTIIVHKGGDFYFKHV